MRYFRPLSTLLVGVALGMFVVPKVTSRLGVPVPGA